MQRTLALAALASLTAITAGAAFAQSNITVYGRANVSLEAQDSNGTKVKREVNNASRLGIKGTEDLGGGLYAGFALEHGFSIDTGLPASTFWGRQSEVYLCDTSFGLVRLGNFTSEAYYAVADYVSMHNHDTGSSADALYAYIGRNGNKLAYRAPELVKGLSAEVATSLPEGNPRIRTFDGAVNYNRGALHLGLGYEKAGEADQIGLRALVELGAFTFGGYVQHDKNGFAPKDPSSGDVVAATAYGSRTTVRVSGMYAFGASELHLNVGRAGDYGDLADSSATQATVAYNYNLSKRTKVYAFYTKISDSAAKVYGGDFSSFALGLRQNF